MGSSHTVGLRDRLALHRITGLGYHAMQRIAHAVAEDYANVWKMPALWRDLGLSAAICAQLANPDWAGVDQDLAWLAGSSDRYYLPYNDSQYPVLLAKIGQPPLGLFVQGDLSLLNAPQIALVGSRQASVTGLESAFNLARDLVQVGLTVTSGLARGIDAASHRGALAGGGMTIAVAGTGLHQVYPRQHGALAEQIRAHGVLVSEYGIGQPLRPSNFPRRNRIIAGLSLGICVVEATLKSGSLITAQCGLEENREIFTLPGSIYNPQSKGCHALLKAGAHLVETYQDILQEIPFLLQSTIATKKTDSDNREEKAMLGQNETIILQQLGYEPTTIYQIMGRTGLSVPLAAAALLELELKNFIVSTEQGFTKKPPASIRNIDN